MNIYRQLIDLLPSDPLLIGAVTAHNADNTSTVEMPDGGTMRARGTGVAVGLNAFIRGGAIEGPAPDLPVRLIEI